jgi:hypothetical protein
LAAAATAAFAIKIGKDAVQGAMEDQKQQVALATALRNTTGATDQAIASTVQYLDKLELLVGVDNNQLIPSLQILTQATKDVTVAQQLQGLALDISAGSSKDLGAVSLALAKAIGGNVGALTRLGVPLDANAVKAKDLDAILESLAATFKGQAEKRAETLEFRLMKLQLAFNQILDKLGYALIPVLEKFAIVITTKILPALNEFVQTNQTKLVAAFTAAADAAVVLLNASINFSNWIANNMGLVKTMAALIFGMFAVGRIAAFVTAIGTITTAMALLRTTAIGAAIANAFATSGVSIALGAAALATVGLGAYTLNNMMKPDAVDEKKGISPRGNANNRDFSVTPYTPYKDPVVFALNKNTTATIKNTKSIMDIATQNAMAELAKRQKALSGGSSIAIGGGSKIYGTRNDQGAINVNVSAGAVVGSTDALIEIVKDGLETVTRRNGTPRGAGAPGFLIT